MIVELPKDVLGYKHKFNHHLDLSIPGQPSDYTPWAKAVSRRQETTGKERAHCLSCLGQSLNIMDRLTIAAGAFVEQSNIAVNWNHHLVVYGLYYAENCVCKSK